MRLKIAVSAVRSRPRAPLSQSLESSRPNFDRAIRRCVFARASPTAGWRSSSPMEAIVRCGGWLRRWVTRRYGLCGCASADGCWAIGCPAHGARWASAFAGLSGLVRDAYVAVQTVAFRTQMRRKTALPEAAALTRRARQLQRPVPVGHLPLWPQGRACTGLERETS